MKKIIIISLFSLNIFYAQIPPLEDHNWKLEKIVTADSILVVPNNIVFEAVFIDNFFEFGNCSPLSGLAIFNDPSQNFEIDEPELGTPISPCPNQPILLDIEFFFQDNYIFSNSNQTTTFEPFSYVFTTTPDKIYLDITNNEGSVATFYDILLSREEFLENNIFIYPNPLKDMLTIRSYDVVLQSISIFDLQGRLLKKYDYFENNQLDLSDLAQSFYILQIKTNQGVLVQKLVKE